MGWERRWCCCWGLLLKRLHDLDAKLDKHIDDSEVFRADVRVLQDRWEREKP